MQLPTGAESERLGNRKFAADYSVDPFLYERSGEKHDDRRQHRDSRRHDGRCVRAVERGGVLAEHSPTSTSDDGNHDGGDGRDGAQRVNQRRRRRTRSQHLATGDEKTVDENRE